MQLLFDLSFFVFFVSFVVFVVQVLFDLLFFVIFVSFVVFVNKGLLMATKYLAGVDVGTTGVRCMIFDLSGGIIGGSYQEYGAAYPRPGWVEQDSDLLIRRTMESCRAAVAESKVAPNDIVSVAFSTQRSVTCPVDARAGRCGR